MESEQWERNLVGVGGIRTVVENSSFVTQFQVVNVLVGFSQVTCMYSRLDHQYIPA